MPTTSAPHPGPTTFDHLAELGRAQARFAALLASCDPDAPLAACPGWTTTDLGLHLAGVHRWAADMVRGEVTDDADPTEPREQRALVELYVAAAIDLTGTLHAVGPDHDCPTLVGRGPAAVWRRRQLHETLVHVVDLEEAAGTGPADRHRVPDEVWSDTVDEVATVMGPRQVRLGRAAAPTHAVALEAGDVGRSWVLGADPLALSRAEPVTEVVARVSGRSRDLALLAWGRRTPDDAGLVVHGDRAALDAVLAGALTP